MNWSEIAPFIAIVVAFASAAANWADSRARIKGLEMRIADAEREISQNAAELNRHKIEAYQRFVSNEALTAHMNRVYDAVTSMSAAVRSLSERVDRVLDGTKH